MATECPATIALHAGARALDQKGDARNARELRRLCSELVVFRRQSRRFHSRVFRGEMDESRRSRPGSRQSVSLADGRSPVRDRVGGDRRRRSRSRSPRRSPGRTGRRERQASGGAPAKEEVRLASSVVVVGQVAAPEPSKKAVQPEPRKSPTVQVDKDRRQSSTAEKEKERSSAKANNKAKENGAKGKEDNVKEEPMESNV